MAANGDSIGELVSRLIGDVERFAKAEVRLYRAQLLDRIDRSKTAAVLLVAALFLAQATITALLVGLILLLRVPLGPGWATLIVVGVALLIVAVLARAGVAKLQGAARPKDDG